jgi:glycosyltransferase involved in cell wall biosynthesis
MKIMHLMPDYIGNKIFKKTIELLANKENSQIVIIPIAYNSKNYRKYNDLIKNTSIKYLKCYYQIDRLLFITKRNKIYKRIQKEITFQSIDIIHAHLLVSMGSIAYEAFKKYSIPYIVSVRSTDIYVFLKYGLFLRPYIKKILENAKKIVFISPVLKEKLLKYFNNEMKNIIEEKSIIIPNWLDNKWFLSNQKSILPNSPFKILFVGELNRNKNILKTISAIRQIRKTGYNIILGIVGEGPKFEKIKSMKEKWILCYGKIDDENELINIYDNYNCLLVPSKRETFGMVYIEAMSRGLPIIYSRYQGIDGFFKNGEVGYSTDPNNINAIAESIKNVIRNYDWLSANVKEKAKQFNCGYVISNLYSVYQEIKNEKL